MIVAMRLAAVVLLGACHSPPAAKEPRPDLSQEPQVAPATPVAEAPSDPVVWPEFPRLAPAPASHPTGAPIAVPFTLPSVGDVERETITDTFEQHYVDGTTTTRFQRTERNFDLGVTVLAVDADHPSKVEVTVDVATESIALASAPMATPNQVTTLLAGTYVVAAGKGGGFERDEAVVSRPGGRRIEGREQEELGSLFGDTLRGGAPLVRFFKSKHLRIGEAVVLNDEAKHAVAAADPLPGTFTLSLASTSPTTVTYQLDVESAGAIPGSADGTFEMRLVGAVTFDRATGRELEQRDQTHKIERHGTSVDDTFTSNRLRFEIVTSTSSSSR